MDSSSFSPRRREEKKWIEVDRPCVVDSKNRAQGERVQTNRIDAEMLIANGLAHASQPSEPQHRRDKGK